MRNKAVYFTLICLWSLYSCNKESIDSDSLAIIPVENIQVSFDLIQGSEHTYKSFAKSKGNVFEITNIEKVKSFISKNRERLLLNNNYSFLWDTINSSKKLYLIDQTKSHSLDPEHINEATNTSGLKQFEIILSAKSKANLSKFFAHNIGKGLIIKDKNGFVASSEKIERLDDGNLMIEK